MATPTVKTLFHQATNTCTHVVYDASSKEAAIIDTVADYDAAAGRISNAHSDEVIKFVEEAGLKPIYIMETHVHADHLTGARYLKEKYPSAKTCIGQYITVVQQTFKGIFNLEEDFKSDGSQFDLLLKEGESYPLGAFSMKIFHTPGHTPACCSYAIGDCVFTGDTLFMPDFGTARCDFPGGSAETLYDSITTKLYSLPDSTRVFVGHDYGPGGRDIKWETTIGESKASNKQIKAGTTKEEFVKFRTERDAQLNVPRLLVQSLQINIRNGHVPPPEANGTSYIKTPLNVL